MSTAVAEPEKTEATPAAEPAKHPGAVTIDLDNLMPKKAEAKAPEKVADKPPEKVEPAPVDEAAKAAELKAAEAKAGEAAKAAEKAKGGSKEENLANLRQLREQAEKAAKEAVEERDRLRTELEKLRGTQPELPEEVKSKLSRAEELEKQTEELRKHLRQADLARDPEFQAKYQKQIGARINSMGDIALSAGVPQEEWKRAVANWNEEQFGEWRENMTPAQRVKFDAAWTGAVDLYQQQQSELENADKTYAEMETQRKAHAAEQQKQYFGQNEKLALETLAEVLKPVSIEDYPDAPEAAKAVLMKAARHEIPAKDIFQQLAANQVLARVVPKQAAEIEELKSQLAERDKKIKEQDEFIAAHASATPRGDAAGNSAPVDDKTPIWNGFVVKTPG